MPASNHAEVLVALLDGPKTRKQLGVSQAKAKRMLDDGVIKIKATMKQTDAEGNPRRGRPSILYAATTKGRRRARKLVTA